MELVPSYLRLNALYIGRDAWIRARVRTLVSKWSLSVAIVHLGVVRKRLHGECK